MKTVWRTRAGLRDEGPNGFVMPQRILEWMQDAAANASALAGYPSERYRAMGAGWFVKEVAFTIDRPIQYREEVAVETWVADFRRFRSRRDYQVRVANEIRARGYAEWLLLERDQNTGRVRPLRPDQELLDAFPILDERAYSDPPAWIDPEGNPQTGARTVQPTELDRHHHVNHTVYLAWLEDHARTICGDGSELKSARLFYESDARLADSIEIKAWHQGSLLRHRVIRSGEVLVKAVTIRELVTRT